MFYIYTNASTTDKTNFPDRQEQSNEKVMLCLTLHIIRLFNDSFSNLGEILRLFIAMSSKSRIVFICYAVIVIIHPLFEYFQFIPN